MPIIYGAPDSELRKEQHFCATPILYKHNPGSIYLCDKCCQSYLLKEGFDDVSYTYHRRWQKISKRKVNRILKRHNKEGN